MRIRDDRGFVIPGLVAIVLSIVVGVGAAVGLSVGLVSVGSQSSQVTEPLVTYNSP